MYDDVIPPNIQRFILEKIESVGELEALLILWSDRDKRWNARSLSRQLYINENKTEQILGALVLKGLVSVEEKSIPEYSYGPGTPELDDYVEALAKIYSRHIVPVTNLIHSKPRIQGFADAFRFRKEDH